MTQNTTTRRIPRLDTTVFKKITKTMKQNKQFSSMVQKSPFYKELIQTVQSNIRHETTRKLSGKKDELKFIFSRFLHLHLIHSILVLFDNEPDCLITLVFPYHMKIDLYTDLDDHGRIVYLVDAHKNDQIQKQMSFWNKDDFMLYMIGLLTERMPKHVDVFRSSVNVSSAPIHLFIQLVEDSFDDTQVPVKMVRIYNERTKEKSV